MRSHCLPGKHASRYAQLIDDVRDDLTRFEPFYATATQVLKVTEELFPQGTNGLDQPEVLKAVFLHLKRQNQGGNAGR